MKCVDLCVRTNVSRGEGVLPEYSRLVEIVAFLSTSMEKDLKTALKHSPCIAIGCDESTDRTGEKHVVVIVRYITTDTEVQTAFLKCIKFKAATIHWAEKDILRKWEVP